MHNPKGLQRHHYTLNYQTDRVEISFIGMDNAKHFELMQYTNLKDKNGVEIYEGDVVKAWSGDFWLRQDKTDTSKDEFEIFYVEWNKRELRWRCQNDNKGPGWYPSIEDSPGRLLFEVIGNIYENKDLLNE